MVLGLLGSKIGIGSGEASSSGGLRKELGRLGLRTINEAKEVLPFQVWDNLGFPKEIIILGYFNGNEMVD